MNEIRQVGGRGIEGGTEVLWIRDVEGFTLLEKVLRASEQGVDFALVWNCRHDREAHL